MLSTFINNPPAIIRPHPNASIPVYDTRHRRRQPCAAAAKLTDGSDLGEECAWDPCCTLQPWAAPPLFVGVPLLLHPQRQDVESSLVRPQDCGHGQAEARPIAMICGIAVRLGRPALPAVVTVCNARGEVLEG